MAKNSNISFGKRDNIFEVEEGQIFSPKFDDNGLIPVITSSSESGEVLMHGYMNKESLQLTLENKEAYYWSRSRKCLWHKGKTSGLIQKVISIRVDDDQDTIWLIVEVSGVGASCHVGYRSCFYRSVHLDKNGVIELNFEEDKKLFDPEIVYQGQENPTKL
ncbi:MAG: phosphoribosyl-AMP cyclohydrolase [Hyphomicrobiales bacterium]|jgi:phosphoribosyl-AMP cyclohydrolase|nr:phosphoribosyl-AMP cyclohydrolase [Hyphomicrobiales bacterium]|tara:strand:- start:656 stop:1138 length:483 start_codon:yes stop_codon:yes gene_type:complete